MLKVDRVSFERNIMAKIYERLLSRMIYHREKNRVSFDSRGQTLSGEESTWMVDRLELPRIVDFLFIYYFACMIQGL